MEIYTYINKYINSFKCRLSQMFVQNVNINSFFHFYIEKQMGNVLRFLFVGCLEANGRPFIRNANL